eukprot:8847338-Pyramimonas_sp.AAC.1
MHDETDASAILPSGRAVPCPAATARLSAEGTSHGRAAAASAPARAMAKRKKGKQKGKPPKKTR